MASPSSQNHATQLEIEEYLRATELGEVNPYQTCITKGLQGREINTRMRQTKEAELRCSSRIQRKLSKLNIVSALATLSHLPMQDTYLCKGEI